MKFIDANATLMVGDLDRAITFYTKTLGFQLEARHGDYFAEVRAPGLTVVLHPRRPGVTPGANHMSLGMRVENIADASAHLRNVGVAFDEQENAANQFVFFQDPDGTALYFIHEKGDGADPIVRPRIGPR
jgi:catechol 2,3-dioxygenase-like lactoylglutathione lyase family enzyme